MKCAAIVLCVTLLASTAWGHALSPALLDLRESPDGLVQVTWKIPSVRAPGAELRPVLPDHCRAVSAAEITEAVESLTTRWTVDCRPQGIVGYSVGVDGLGRAMTDALVRVALVDGRVVQAVARVSEPVVAVQAPSHPATIVAGYWQLGIEHILSGRDHLLFVFGLLLLAGGFRRVIETVTAFTVGHSVTLSLAVLGVSNIPQRPVEVAIAITIFVLALELTRGPEQKTSLLRRFPWGVSFAFGLLHGFGFAGALRETGLPPGDIPRALFSFNVGIECGQLAFIAGVLGLHRLLRRARVQLPGWAAVIPAYAMGSVAVLWCLERAEVLFR